MKTAMNNQVNFKNKMLLMGILAFGILNAAPMFAQTNTTEALLHSFAKDYENDLMFQERSFGIEVDKEMWQIVTKKGVDNGPNQITIRKGNPEEPTFYFVTNLRSLAEIEAGQMNALTAGVKAFSTDYAPMDVDIMEGFQPPADFAGSVLPFMLHFFTKGTPEMIPFGKHYTRATHGAMASIFYYDTGVRSGYGYIHPGQHANENPNSRTNPFSSMLILIKGKAVARLNGVDHEIEKGNALFIPPGMTHEFLNPFEEAVEFILLMFGEGA